MRRRRPVPLSARGLLSARALLSAAVLLAAAGCGSAVSGSGGSSGPVVPSSSPESSVAVPSSSASSAAASSSARPVPRSSSARPSAPRITPPPVSSAIALPPVSGHPTIVLNPGHNGGNAAHSAEINRQVPAGFGEYKACDTTGTNTDAGYPEHAFTWDVTLRVRAILQSRGVSVVLTRPNDTGVGPCVDERAAIGNRPGVSAVVSIHADGGPAGGRGFHVGEDSRQPAGPAVAARSHALTVAVHDALVAGSGLVTSTYIGTNGYYPRDDLAGLNLATVPATFLELGNMRNAGDAALLSSATGRARIAAAVAAGILRGLNR